MTDPTRCPHCGVALRDATRMPWNHIELDTGETHVATRCRDYLVAERDRERESKRQSTAAWVVANRERAEAIRDRDALRAHVDKLIELFDGARSCNDACDLSAILSWVDPADLERVSEMMWTVREDRDAFRAALEKILPIAKAACRGSLPDGDAYRAIVDYAHAALAAVQAKETAIEPAGSARGFEDGPFPETIIHTRLDGSMRKYIPVDGIELQEMISAAVQAKETKT